MCWSSFCILKCVLLISGLSLNGNPEIPSENKLANWVCILHLIKPDHQLILSVVVTWRLDRLRPSSHFQHLPLWEIILVIGVVKYNTAVVYNKLGPASASLSVDFQELYYIIYVYIDCIYTVIWELGMVSYNILISANYNGQWFFLMLEHRNLRNLTWNATLLIPHDLHGFPHSNSYIIKCDLQG